MAILKNTTISDTGFLQLPVGTTAQRSAPTAGQMRFNTDTGKIEFYNSNAGTWVGTAATGVVATGGTVYDVDVEGTAYRVHVFTSTGNSTFTVAKGGEVEYLIVAGGGGTAGDVAGAGGAGGLLTGTTTVISQNYTITVGASGIGAPVGSANNLLSTNGGNSSAFGLTAIGGGRGGNYRNQGSVGNGGSGGGAPGGDSNYSGGTGNVNQGNNGGNHSAGTSPHRSAGGGGAGSLGGDDSASFGGKGGIGIVSFITGLTTFYAGGGGGGFSGAEGQNVGGAGGLGGGGNGKDRTTVNPGNSGTPNTGGGGGGNAHPHYGGSSGGSGIVVIRYPLRQENPIQAAGRVVGDGLVLDLDFAKPTVYAGSGTTVSDSRLNRITGTLGGGITFTNPRTHRSVFKFDGIDDHIDLGQEYILKRSGGSLLGWCYVDDFTTTAPVTVPSRIFVTRTTNNFSSQIAFYEGGFGYETDTNSNPNDVASRTVPNHAAAGITAGEWFHFVMVFSNNNTSRVYINGNLVHTVTNINNDLRFRYIGYRAGPTNYPDWYKGEIGIIQLYNLPLSASEIIQQYNATRWRFGV